MNVTPMYIVFAGVAGIAQYGTLLLNLDTKDRIWKFGLYIGMIGSAYAGSALAADDLTDIELYPFLTFMGSIAIMLSCVVLDYYLKPVPASSTDEQRQVLTGVKHRALVQIGIGLAITICVATCVGFTKGQTAESRVQQGLAGVVYRLADEVKALHEALNSLTSDVKQLKTEARKKAVADSIANVKTLRNQERMLKQGRK
ncbi:hypothetical protein GCM10027592_29430 [Spirosoma flavus]